jgi:hypothetical protein
VYVATHIIYIIYPHYSLVGILVGRYIMVSYHIFNHCLLEDKYDTLDYSRSNATTVFCVFAEYST